MASETKDENFNPFPGLRPYTPGDADFFFGRQGESEEIARKVIENRFVALIGASGTGKSSLIRCGLIPAIRKLSQEDFQSWKIVMMNPGRNPFDSLAEAISVAFPDNEYKGTIRGLLKESTKGIPDILSLLHLKKDSKILLVIDQLEQLFRYGQPETGTGLNRETPAFLNLLTRAILDSAPGFYLAVAIRSDLLAECAHHKGFTQIINNSNYLLPKMTRDNVREVIEGPVKRAGAAIDPALVAHMTDEVIDVVEQLPLLQHALMRTWESWKELDEPGRPIGFDDYNSIGTVKGAISRHADEIYGSLSNGSKVICEKLFKIITGKGSDNKGIRYPSNVRTIRSAIHCTGEELFEVIDKYRDPSIFLLNPDSTVALNDDSIIDLSHESLITLWDRLKMWVNEENQSVELYLHLSEASALYQQGKTGLLKPPDLQLAIDWREKNNPDLWWAQKYNPAFERAMVYLRTSEKEFAEAEERKARQQRWRLRRTRIFTSITGGLAVITALITIGALVSKFSADNRRRMAERMMEEITAEKDAAGHYATIAIKRSVESDSIASEATRKQNQERLLREKAEQDYQAAEREAMTAHAESETAIKTARSVAEAKDEMQRQRMLSISKSMSLRSLQMKGEKDLQALLAYQAYLFNRNNRGKTNDPDIYEGMYNLAKLNGSALLRSFTGYSGQVSSIAFVPGKKEFFTADSEGKVLKWDLDSKANSFQVVYSNSEVIDVLAVSPDAGWLACGGESAGIKMIPLQGSIPEYELKGHSGKIRSLVFSFDGRYLYSAALDGKVLKWDLSTKASVELTTTMAKVTSIDLSSDNRYIAGVGSNGQAVVWNPGQNAERFTIGSEGRTIRTIRFKPGEEEVAVGYDDGMVELWDAGSKSMISEFRAHPGEVSNIRFNNRQKQMATSGSDGTLKLWDTGDLTSLPVSFGNNNGLVVTFEFSPDGEVILSAGIEGKPEIRRRPAYADLFAADGCSYVTRNFTPEEWIAYVGRDIAYEKTCPESDFKIIIREIR
ncbi:MAG: hypothetical protein WCE64_09330 [Bacteroidales bacterium]